MLLGQQVQQKLIQKFNAAKARISKNRLKLVSFLNLLTFGSFMFGMFFYQWALVKIKVKIHLGHQSQPTNDLAQQYNIYNIWINLLYLKQVDLDYYQTFPEAQSSICLRNDLGCNATFLQLQFTGILCFLILTVAGGLQVYDFLRILYYMTKNMKLTQVKDHFRHILTILAYLIGLSLSVFSIWVIDPIEISYGVSFWICSSTVFLFVIVIIIEKLSVRNMQKRKLIQDLIDQQKKIRVHQIQKQVASAASDFQL